MNVNDPDFEIDLTEEEMRLWQEHAKYSREYYFSHFWEIAEEHRKRRKEMLEILDSEYDENSEWQTDKFFDAHTDAFRSGCIIIVFSAMFIEAGIYNFAAIHLSDKFVIDNLDKLSIIPKIRVIFRLVCNQDLGKNSEALMHVNRLFKHRNFLIHDKSTPLSSSIESIKRKDKERQNFDEALESSIKAVKLLDKEVGKILQNEMHPFIFGV